MSIDRLRQLDGLRVGASSGRRVWLHNDHRWTVSLIAIAQEEGIVPTPCRLLVFDRHHDSLTPNCLPELRRARSGRSGASDVMGLCENHLRILDDDWIKAAMELGRVDDAVVFGVDERPYGEELVFEDHCGQRHQFMLTGLPGGGLGYQGCLGDLARSHELAELWKALNWKHLQGGFDFTADRPRSFVSIDLDCFIIDWREYLFPWLEEVYTKEFLTTSTYFPTAGWTGKQFFQGLIEGAGVVDIAREPTHCGGEDKADRVLSDMNRLLFDNSLHFE